MPALKLVGNECALIDGDWHTTILGMQFYHETFIWRLHLGVVCPECGANNLLSKTLRKKAALSSIHVAEQLK